MYRLKYFVKIYNDSNGLCGSDFDNDCDDEFINLNYIVSFSSIKKFYLPFSNKYKGNYAIVSMANGDRFYIHPDEHEQLCKEIEGPPES